MQDNPADVPGAGSCSFLRRSARRPIGHRRLHGDADRREDALLGWMRHAVLVQLPVPVYRQVPGGWGLPPD